MYDLEKQIFKAYISYNTLVYGSNDDNDQIDLEKLEKNLISLSCAEEWWNLEKRLIENKIDRISNLIW